MVKSNPFNRVIFYLFLFFLGLNAEKTFEEKIDSVNAIPYSYIVSNPKESIQIFSDNLKEAKEKNYSKGIAFSSYNLALAYYISGQYDSSTSSFLTSIKVFEEIGLTKEKAASLGEFGYQIKRSDLPKANKYMREGIKLAEENKFEYVLAKLYDNYGVLKEMENDLDSAMYFYNKSLDKKIVHKDSVGIPYSLNKIAGVYGMQKNIKKALEIMAQSDAYRNKEEGDFGRIENLVLYGDIYKSGDNINRAIDYYEKGLEKACEHQINYLIRYCFKQLTELYQRQGKYQRAFDALNSYTSYKDSVLNKEVQLRVAELELDYQTEKKDRLIAENKLEISEKTSQLYLLFGLTLLLVFTSFAVFVYQKRKREKLILTNKLHEAELEAKLSDEKLRISRELHDNIGSQITFMVSSIDNFVYKSNEKLEVLNNISDFGRDALAELRNTIWALKQKDANINELIIKINDLVRKINTAITSIKIRVSNNVIRDVYLSSVQMLNLFRITQEAIQNVIKHSEASEATIEFNEIDNFLNLKISDNGKGFNMNAIQKGNGIESMKKRCNDYAGKFDISSSPEGTKIECSIKIN